MQEDPGILCCICAYWRATARAVFATRALPFVTEVPRNDSPLISVLLDLFHWVQFCSAHIPAQFMSPKGHLYSLY